MEERSKNDFMNTSFFQRLEVIHHMSSLLGSDFVEEVKGGRLLSEVQSQSSWTTYKNPIKAVIKQLYCSFPAPTQWK